MIRKILILILIPVILLSAFAYYLNQPPSIMRDEVFVVHEGESLRMISSRLKKNNLIKNSNFFLASGAVNSGYNYKSGKYRIKRGMTSFDILKVIYLGRVLSEKITIPEGYNIYEIAEKLDDSGITSRREFLNYCTDRQFLKKIGINSSTAEGYLFPDTYVFNEDMNAGEVIKVMYKRFSNVIDSIGMKEIKKSGLSFGDVIKMASLIEEEAAVSTERKYISSVFHNRIKKNMRFDCDPTVRYAVKKFSGRIYFSDLKTDSPYNTYLYKGFPPTPISSPGRESILAAIYPAESSFLYFVSRNDRSHYFSSSLKEHNSAVKKFRDGNGSGFTDNQRLN
ncbi:MAG TPA: endolytic transglycosylase MltG [Spirochaetota bacterium]|nr:endolytic transglycosylase MltG [Spirochaetota bacterium]